MLVISFDWFDKSKIWSANFFACTAPHLFLVIAWLSVIIEERLRWQNWFPLNLLSGLGPFDDVIHNRRLDFMVVVEAQVLFFSTTRLRAPIWLVRLAAQFALCLPLTNFPIPFALASFSHLQGVQFFLRLCFKVEFGSTNRVMLWLRHSQWYAYSLLRGGWSIARFEAVCELNVLPRLCRCLLRTVARCFLPTLGRLVLTRCHRSVLYISIANQRRLKVDCLAHS